MDNIKDGLNKFLSSGDQDGGDADPVKNEMGAGNEQQSDVDQQGGDKQPPNKLVDTEEDEEEEEKAVKKPQKP